MSGIQRIGCAGGNIRIDPCALPVGFGDRVDRPPIRQAQHEFIQDDLFRFVMRIPTGHFPDKHCPLERLEVIGELFGCGTGEPAG